jgi:hypothetical protein
MKIVIFGNMGYVGPGVIERVRSTYQTGTLIMTQVSLRVA